ncbi:MAG: hypothetical protein JNJ54_16955 [Myxococcaceae bacterium]|nr:hypothetical protein [Myxococcaceae bacterium]
MRTVLLVAALWAPAALADHTVSVGGFAGTTAASFNSSPGVAGPTVGWLYTRGVVGVGAGLRASAPSAVVKVPLEGYARGVFTIALGRWEPLLGPELGLSGLQGFSRPLPGRPTDLANAEGALTGFFYVAFHTEAARFRFGRVMLSLLGFDVGTSLTAAGATLRLQLDWLTVGVRW